MNSIIKINILVGTEGHGKEFFEGFWSPLHFFKDEINKIKINFNFFFKLKDSFYNCDFIFLSSRYFQKKNVGEKRLDNLIEEIFEKNKNIVWFDNRDSAGTTQFEVLPFVKFYVKKQYYKNLKLYETNMYGGRRYSDFYHNNYAVNDKNQYAMKTLKKSYKKKLILGWNLGVKKFKISINHNKFASHLFYYIKKVRYLLTKKIISENINFREYDNKRHVNLLAKFNTNIDRESVVFQRKLGLKALKATHIKKIISGDRIPLNYYYQYLLDTKIVMSLFGWGEICYREFEATVSGCTFIMPSMENIITWPNIYKKNETYLPIDWDFNNLNSTIEKLLKDSELRYFLIKNAQTEIKNVRKDEGKKYVIDFLRQIIN